MDQLLEAIFLNNITMYVAPLFLGGIVITTMVGLIVKLQDANED